MLADDMYYYTFKRRIQNLAYGQSSQRQKFSPQLMQYKLTENGQS